MTQQGQQGQGGHTGAQQQAIQHQNNLPYPIGSTPMISNIVSACLSFCYSVCIEIIR